MHWGGGVSRWTRDSGTWINWSKTSGANIAAFGDGSLKLGEMTAVLADRVHDRVWAGSWTAEGAFHWLEGFGVHAALNWCPIESCSDGNWEHTIWAEDGKVSAIELDGKNNLWVGTHRNGNGLIPSFGRRQDLGRPGLLHVYAREHTSDLQPDLGA